MLELVIALAVGVCLIVLAWRLLRLFVALALVVVLIAVGIGLAHRLGHPHGQASATFASAQRSVVRDASGIEHGVQRIVGSEVGRAGGQTVRRKVDLPHRESRRSRA